MFDSVTVLGATGRSGSAICARLRERGVALREHSAELIVLCVPDRAIAEVARGIEPGPWICHVSGATPLAALEPHRLRFSVHPLQTLVAWRGPEQLDGAYGAVSAESPEALERGLWLARTLGLRPFQLPDGERHLYHAAAMFASGYLVTLHRAASRLARLAGAPPEGLECLMRRTIDNGFELTGPIARGDWGTVEAHLAGIRAHVPELEPLYRALAQATQLLPAEKPVETAR
ncbi:MAG TPA: DUF2520 domain-containing protein [Gaiellaceae bacterium]|nr:DUF2520 domain-containing protein [Gaiellaceae bacterium]